MSAAPRRPREGVAAWRTRPERGSPWLLRAMVGFALLAGRSAARLVLVPITAYYFAFAPAAGRASRAFLARALGRPSTPGERWRHLHTFAATLLDRVYLLRGQYDAFEIEVHGEPLVADAQSSGRGALLFGAHVGSFEALRAYGHHQPGLRVAMLMFEAQSARMMQVFEAIAPGQSLDIIGLGRPDSLLRARDRLDAGAFVGLLADRALGGDEVRELPFLGAPMAVPVGPFRIAALLRRPVLTMVGLYLGGRRYRLEFAPLADFTEVGPDGREAAIEAAMAAYVARLETWCRASPWNWFNFFDVWEARAPGA